MKCLSEYLSEALSLSTYNDVIDIFDNLLSNFPDMYKDAYDELMTDFEEWVEFYHVKEIEIYMPSNTSNTFFTKDKYKDVIREFDIKDDSFTKINSGIVDVYFDLQATERKRYVNNKEYTWGTTCVDLNEENFFMMTYVSKNAKNITDVFFSCIVIKNKN